MSRYRSVPLSTTARPGTGCRQEASPRLCVQASTEAAERRACRATMALSCATAGPSGHWVTMRAWKPGWLAVAECRNFCQRRAVCQLPLLASASAGLTITTCFFTEVISHAPRVDSNPAKLADSPGGAYGRCPGAGAALAGQPRAHA